jgi:hypothetical protein
MTGPASMQTAPSPSSVRVSTKTLSCSSRFSVTLAALTCLRAFTNASRKIRYTVSLAGTLIWMCIGPVM